MPSHETSVLGDFVVARGPGAEAWARALDGFTVVSAPGERTVAAVRGDARHGSTPDGGRWVAVADLISGRLEEADPRGWAGRFVSVAWHPGDERIAATTDHFSTLSLYALEREEVVVFATDLRVLGPSPWVGGELDLEAVYHYLNFACIPAPRTIFRRVRSIEPGTRVAWRGGGLHAGRWFLPEYPEDLRGSEEELSRELRERMIATVESYGPADGAGWGCFLSGGTDSSSIVSILARQRGPGTVRSFSIGFAEQDYDELSFAEAAASACGADAKFHRVSREEAQRLVSSVVEAYDQPFGNSSAIPTLACTTLAQASGARVLLAGDGGDEIFGGNERYAKDQVMEAFFALPAALKAVGRAIGAAAGGSRVHLLNRIENFVQRSSLPNPERFYSDEGYASDHYAELLTPEFRASVAREASLDFMRSVYQLGTTGGPLHRIMRLDLLMAIAQNDLVKVHGAARAAGVSVRFPYLDPALVAWVNRLPERHKVRRLTKRWLFKRAMRPVLPEKILKKKKQGFGLPIAVWLRHDPAFRSFVRETLFSQRSRARGWWRPEFVESLFAEHDSGAWDNSDAIWRLFILELWLRRSADVR
jgi:asparagine synthase (glutamine-hydrolysing)